MRKSGGAQFTPGPWVVKSTDEDINTKTVVDGNEFWIARVLNFNRASDDIRESQANATLIAAAPVMYAAGQVSLGVLVQVAAELERTGNEELWSIVRSAIIEQKTALAKAEGQHMAATLPEKYNTMLDALKAVVELCDDGDADELTQEAAEIAKTAIAKAEGRER